MSKKTESLITLVVRRGALRRFDKLKKETANLPVVVAWDRRTADPPPDGDRDASAPSAEDRRRQPSFTWDLADFLVVPGEPVAAESPGQDADAEDPAEEKSSRRG